MVTTPTTILKCMITAMIRIITSKIREGANTRATTTEMHMGLATTNTGICRLVTMCS